MLSTALRIKPSHFSHFSRLSKFIPKSLSTSSSPSPSQFRPWSGLQQWRLSPINEGRVWGPSGPETPPDDTFTAAATVAVTDNGPLHAAVESTSSLAEMGFLVLSAADPLTKSKLSHLAYSRWRHQNLPVGVFDPPARPARSPKPQLVSTKEMPAPKESGLPLNAYMLHNLAHVELNAIDLAWDTVVRFSPHSEVLGKGFFEDFAHVADDESRHFAWCFQRLAELGFSYGDMPAHNLLWRECEKSSDNVAARLATIPLVQEARGLDAGPRLVQKLVGFGDHRTSHIVAKIADEEVAHVAVGVSWFVFVCQKTGRVPCSAFRDILSEYNVEIKGPFNYTKRDEAGLPRHWYDAQSSSTDTVEQSKEQLNGVYERLAHIIAMENENASSNPPRHT